MEDAADARITAMGMLVEANAGLGRLLSRDLATHLDLPIAWFEVLLRLVRTPGHRMRMSQLAAEVSFSTSGLTRLADRMEAAGLIRREACPSDRRGSFATLTEAGEAKIADAIPVHLRGLDEHLAGALSDAELETLTALLRKVRDRVAGAGGCGAPADEG